MQRQVIGGLILSLMLAGSSPAVPQTTEKKEAKSEKEISIRIHDYARVESQVLIQAERAAGERLREAGVEAIWVKCSKDDSQTDDGAGCKRQGTDLSLVLNLLPREMSRRLHLREDAIGVAFESSEDDFGYLASVFYDSVRDCVVQRGLDLPQILGDAMAHEIGHLLLGRDSHASKGLMCALWSGKELRTAERSGLMFSRSEAERIQKAMAARRLAAAKQDIGSSEAEHHTVHDRKSGY